MTLVLRFDPDIVKMNASTENEVLSFSNAKVSDRQTDRQTRLKLLPAALADGNNNDLFNDLCDLRLLFIEQQCNFHTQWIFFLFQKEISKETS